MHILKKIKRWIDQRSTTSSKKEAKPTSSEVLSRQHIVAQFTDCFDFVERNFPENGVYVHYLTYLIGHDELNREILTPFANASSQDVELVLERAQYRKVTTAKDCVVGILSGQAAIFFRKNVYLVDITHHIGRAIAPSETETVITGPHDGFVEEITQNLAILRRRIKSNHLKFVKLTVGEITKTSVMLTYIADIVNEELVETLKKRITSIEIDAVFDGNMLVQFIDENPNSIFPQYLTTERPDVVCSKLTAGRIVGFVDGSPSAFCAPTAFFDFFSSPDDYYQRWHIGTALRVLRIMGFIITGTFTALYVAVATFHYEMIPHTMLLQLTQSRSKVPFPPLIEALIMELTIEFLREAGARLPSKIGQTIGIVGGIVIGQASVQAGFTSNILIIVVAISAIASFVIPTYIMSASFRLIRFGLIVLAGLLGSFGLMFGIALIIIHLAGITNLGTSYLTPIAPFSFRDWLDTFVRAPFYTLKERPTQSKVTNKWKNKMRK